MAVTDILVGDRVRWENEIGEFRRGTVVEVTPTAIIADFFNYNVGCRAMLLRDELAEMNFKVTFRDVEIQIARGEKVFV